MTAIELVAHNLRRLRVKAGLSQEILAVDAGIDRTYVSRIERGLENCSIGILDKLAAALGCEVVEFFQRSDGSVASPLRSGRKKK